MSLRRHIIRAMLPAFAVAATALFSQSGPAYAASITITVNDVGDGADFDGGSGACNTLPSGGPVCTMRAAIETANAHLTAPNDPDRVSFNITGGCAIKCTIAPASTLPGIFGPVVIDGFSQPGASVNTNPVNQPSNGVLKIFIDGLGHGFGSGLSLSATQSTIRGLDISHFGVGVGLFGATLSQVAGNVIHHNSWGIEVTGGSQNNTIGNLTPDARAIPS